VSWPLPTNSFAHPTFQVPGPGSYQAQLAGSRSSPAFSMRIRPSDARASAIVPGPGTYTVKDFLGKEGKGRSISLRLKSQEIMSTSPGPGSYSPQRLDNYRSLSVSIKGAIASSKKEEVPGPGAYTVIEKQSNAPAYTMGTRTLMLSEGKKETPGYLLCRSKFF
jgi:hypothetical protein